MNDISIPMNINKQFPFISSAVWKESRIAYYNWLCKVPFQKYFHSIPFSTSLNYIDMMVKGYIEISTLKAKSLKNRNIFSMWHFGFFLWKNSLVLPSRQYYHSAIQMQYDCFCYKYFKMNAEMNFSLRVHNID